MLRIEYLVFIENVNVKSSNEKTFNHLLQSDPDIEVRKDKLIHKKLQVDYLINSGKVKNTNETYFHISINCDEEERINEFIDLLKSVKSILYLINKTPQILYDGISLYYSNLAYPLIFEIENLMRKLITKFMLTNVGINWIKERVPDDVKNSINPSNKDATYLHNVDFIQLKNFLFSESYSTHKENLISKLKAAKNISELNLEEIKTLIPESNWEKYFSNNVDISKEKLNRKWDEIYELRCKIAHNRTFDKSDYETVKILTTDVKSVLLNAIKNLEKIDISEGESSMLAEIIAGNFNSTFGEFIFEFNEMVDFISRLVENKIFVPFPGEKTHYHPRSIIGDIHRLTSHGLLDEKMNNYIRHFINIRNQILLSWTDNPSLEDVIESLSEIKKVNKTLNGWL